MMSQKFCWGKNDQNLPVGWVKHWNFLLYQKSRLHAILSHLCIRQRTCIQDFLTMHFSLYTLMKDACKVLGCDSNAKWSVGAITGMGSLSQQIASKLLANYHEWLWKYIHIIYNFWSMGTLHMYEWKVHVKCWGVILLSSGPLSYQSGRHHGMWARQVGTRGGYVGIGTKILGRPHYFSFTSYTPPPCNHPSCHDIAPSLCHLYPQRSLPLSHRCTCGHGILLSWQCFIAIATSTSSSHFNLVIEDHHHCRVLPLSASSPPCDHYHCRFLGRLLFAKH